jgi:4-hydroxybenzoate polyprenyltransferase
MHTVSIMFRLVKFEHTVFALPFAYAGMLLAASQVSSGASQGLGTLSWNTVLWITVAMVGARTCAMAVNRLVDAAIDARNPRTAGREIPSGAISRQRVAGLIVVSLALLVLATTQLDPITRILWPIPVVMFVVYPYTKRFTWMCHAVLGVSIGLAAPGAWLAVTGEAPLPAWLLAAAIATWIGGFDVIYATQDVEVDRAEGLHSLPARFGIARALTITRVSHVVTIACLAGVGAACGLGVVYWIGLGVVAALLAWENSIVSPHDLRRVNAAFFTINGVLGIVYMLAVLTAVV